MANGIYLPDGTFQPFQRSALSTELANRQTAGLSLGELDGWLSILPDPDPVLRKRRDEASVLADLAADDQVTMAMLARKNRVLNCPHLTFRAGAPDGGEATPQATALHDAFMRDLERTNLRSVISGMLDAPFFGFAPLELLWRSDGDWWHLVDIIPRPPQWFAFNETNKPVFVGNYGVFSGAPQGIPAGKMVFVTHHATYDNPYGLRLLSRCLWPVTFKRGGLQFYARFVERHGMPWVVGEAPVKAEKSEKRDMAADLARMVQDCVAVIPNGAKVEFLTAGQTQGALHEAFLARQDKAISKILMGQTLTAEMEGTNSLAAAETHKDVADDLADADKAMVVDAWNEIAWLYAQLNAGPNVLAPLAAYEEPEDLTTRAELDKKLFEIGASFTAEHFTDKYGLKETEFTIRDSSAVDSRNPALQGTGTADAAFGRSADSTAAPMADAPAANFAAPAAPEGELPAVQAQRSLDTAIKNMLPQVLKTSGEFVTQVENAVKDARTFDDLQQSLAELLAPRMKPDALESLLAQAMVAAAGHGSASVQAEAEGDK